MPVFNASSFLLYKDETAIGHSKDVVITIELDLKESTTKDSQGFAEFMPSIIGGKAKVRGLTAYDDSLNFTQFADYVITRAEQQFYFKDPNVNDFIVNAKGIVESVDEVGDHESVTEFNLDIKLTGIFSAGSNRNWENIFEFWEDIAREWQNV